MATHKYVGNHAAEVAGVMRAPGETFDLTKEQLEDPNVQDYLNSNSLMALENKKGGDNK